MPTRSSLRLGTRTSLLAMAQGRHARRALQLADPGRDVQVIRCVDPIAALRAGRIDACLHALEESVPADLHPAAILPRGNPRDIALFRSETEAMLGAAERLRIGASSARRARQAQTFLERCLPRCTDPVPRLDFAVGVETVEHSLARLRLPLVQPEALEGVVVSMADLSRLWSDREGHAAIAPLLEGARRMILPLAECPGAPGQGARALLCRAGDDAVKSALIAIHDTTSARRVQRELALRAAQPQVERTDFSVATLAHERCGTLLFVRGRHAERPFERLLWPSPAHPSHAIAWDGADWIEACRHRPAQDVGIGAPQVLFLAHSQALPERWRPAPTTPVWVGNIDSWRRLARQGIWVEGCADQLGFAAIRDTLRAPVLRLPPLSDWTVLTRADSLEAWEESGVGCVLATYAVSAPEDATVLAPIRARVAAATHFFWGSVTQYRALQAWVPREAHHACGPGGLWQALRAAGLMTVQAFPSRREWRAWVG